MYYAFRKNQLSPMLLCSILSTPLICTEYLVVVVVHKQLVERLVEQKQLEVVSRVVRLLQRPRVGNWLRSASLKVCGSCRLEASKFQQLGKRRTGNNLQKIRHPDSCSGWTLSKVKYLRKFWWPPKILKRRLLCWMLYFLLEDWGWNTSSVEQ